MPLSSQITEGQSLCLHCEAGRDLCGGDASSMWIQPVLLGIAGFEASTPTPKRCRAGGDVNHCRPQWQTSVLLAQMLQTPLLRALPAHLPASRKKNPTKFPPVGLDLLYLPTSSKRRSLELLLCAQNSCLGETSAVLPKAVL